MRNNWEMKSLDEVCEFRRGLTYSKSDEVVLSKNAVLRANNIDPISNTLNFDEIRYIRDGIDIPQNKKIIKDSIFICTASGSKSHLGKVAFIDKDYNYAFGGFMGLLVPNKNVIEPKFFYKILISADFRKHLDALTAGANINNLKFSQIEHFNLFLPPLPEQKRILKILDKKFEMIEKLKKVTEQQLKDAKELFESRSVELFESVKSSNKYQLNDLLKKKWILSHLDGNHGGDYPRKEEFKSAGVPYISANCIKSNKVDFSLVKYLTPERAGKLRKGIAQNGDVLFAHNATVGPVAVLKTSAKKIILSTSLTYYRCNPEFIDNMYLSHFMQSPMFVTQYELVMKQMTRNQVPITKQREFFFHIPDILAQKRISRELDVLSEKTNELKAIYRKKIFDLEELKKSYLQDAFAGKLK